MGASDHHSLLSAAIRTLTVRASPACLLDLQGVFIFVNQAWDRVAEQSGGGPGALGSSLIGTAWIDHLEGDEVRRHHAALLDRAMRADGARPRRLVQVAEANSPTEARLVATRFEPIVVRGSGERLGVAVTHELVRVRPIEEVYAVVPGEERGYRDAEGRVAQCPCCRRASDPATASWEFAPALLQTPPRTVRWTFCELCLDLHFPEARPEEGASA